MRLILIGPPGSGKGTQAKLLSDRLHLAHIATGDILREAMRLRTSAGRKAKPFVKKGKLVPDDIVNQLVANRFRREDRPERFVMDGYPRTLAQAASFDQVLRQQFLNLTAVIVLRVNDEEKEETIRHRLEVYRTNTLELIPHYQRQGLVREVTGEGEIDRIYNNIVQVL